jgi:hypothetical protein
VVNVNAHTELLTVKPNITTFDFHGAFLSRCDTATQLLKESKAPSSSSRKNYRS